jgi:hypothetical protein
MMLSVRSLALGLALATMTALLFVVTVLPVWLVDLVGPTAVAWFEGLTQMQKAVLRGLPFVLPAVTPGITVTLVIGFQALRRSRQSKSAEAGRWSPVTRPGPSFHTRSGHGA